MGKAVDAVTSAAFFVSSRKIRPSGPKSTKSPAHDLSPLQMLATGPPNLEITRAFRDKTWREGCGGAGGLRVKWFGLGDDLDTDEHSGRERRKDAGPSTAERILRRRGPRSGYR